MRYMRIENRNAGQGPEKDFAAQMKEWRRGYITCHPGVFVIIEIGKFMMSKNGGSGQTSEKKSQIPRPSSASSIITCRWNVRMVCHDSILYKINALNPLCNSFSEPRRKSSVRYSVLSLVLLDYNRQPTHKRYNTPKMVKSLQRCDMQHHQNMQMC